MAGENNDLVRGLGLGATQLTGNLVLDASGSNAKSLVLARLTSAQRDAIASPETGLMIYNTDTNKLNFFDATAWEIVTSA